MRTGNRLKFLNALELALKWADVLERFAIDNLHRAVSAQFTLRQPDLAIAASPDFFQQLVIWNRRKLRRSDGVLKCWSDGRTNWPTGRLNQVIARVRGHFVRTLPERKGKETANRATHVQRASRAPL